MTHNTDKNKRMTKTCVALYLMDILDLVMTYRLIFLLGLGTEVEANPLFAEFIEANPIIAAMFKIFGVGAFIWVLWYASNKSKIARYGIIGLTTIFTILSIYHFYLVFL